MNSFLLGGPEQGAPEKKPWKVQMQFYSRVVRFSLQVGVARNQFVSV